QFDQREGTSVSTEHLSVPRQETPPGTTEGGKDLTRLTAAPPADTNHHGTRMQRLNPFRVQGRGLNHGVANPIVPAPEETRTGGDCESYPSFSPVLLYTRRGRW